MPDQLSLSRTEDSPWAPDYSALCGTLSQRVPEIMVEWSALTTEEPWFSLPPDERVDSLPRVVLAMVRASLCSPSDSATLREHVWAAAEHGATRREQAFPQELVFTEYYLLREAIWRYLQKVAPVSEATSAILRLDHAITLATRASIQGYHRRELTRMGRWPAAIDAIAAEAVATAS